MIQNDSSTILERLQGYLEQTRSVPFPVNDRLVIEQQHVEIQAKLNEVHTALGVLSGRSEGYKLTREDCEVLEKAEEDLSDAGNAIALVQVHKS